MPLPTVSRETYEAVQGEWLADHAAFCSELTKRLEEENPVIGKFLTDYFETHYDHDPVLLLGLILACSIYKALEIEGQVPVVSEEIGASMRAEFERNPRGCVMLAAHGILGDQPNLLSFFADLLADLYINEDSEGVSRVIFAGISVYKMLKDQVESNELSETIGK